MDDNGTSSDVVDQRVVSTEPGSATPRPSPPLVTDFVVDRR